MPNHGTAHLLLKLEKTGCLTKGEARKTLDGMIEEGWRCSTEIYAEILKASDYRGYREARVVSASPIAKFPYLPDLNGITLKTSTNSPKRDR